MTIRIDPHVRIPLRDGVELSATLFLPPTSAESAPGPAICALTPYLADNYFARGRYLAENGIPFLSVEVRGRGDSGGQFRPNQDEFADGHDVIEWLAAQPFCDGQVGMCGGSYGGFAQWAAATGHSPHLATIVPTAAACIGVDFPYRNGISYQYLLQWLTFVDGRGLKPNWFGDMAWWRQLWRARYERGASFASLADELGGNWPLLKTIIDRIEKRAFVDQAPSAADFAGMTMPVLTITGSYDDDQPGALAHYARHLAAVPEDVAARHYLVMGPWDHAGTRVPTETIGGVAFGPASMVDMDRLHLDWYRWTMAGGERPALLKKRVAYYVMGAERWRHCDTLAEATGREVAYFLDSAGTASSIAASGSLGTAAPTGTSDRYVYDPRDVSLAALEAEIDYEDPAEDRMVLARDGRHLVYHSQPFDAPTEITGFFRLDAWLAVDVPDTDFAVRVYEITAEGGSILLTSDLLRARYRDGEERPALIPDAEPIRYRFDRFLFVSREIARGSRLRLTIGPNDTIHAQKNFNGGGVVSEETFTDARVATVRLFHDAAHLSALTIPFGRTQDDD